MKFCVFIRSIEERTEGLSYQSVRKHIPEEDIFIIRNQFPSYKAYSSMFRIAIQKKLDWFLGLDADVILAPNWFETFKKRTDEGKDYFRIHFLTKDLITNQFLVRGNNFYNGQMAEKSYYYLRKNINIGRFWFFYKWKGFHSGYFLKPETSIRTHFKTGDVLDQTFQESIGWHGYEQYYYEIYRQYLTRRFRDPAFATKDGNEFLNFSLQDPYFIENDEKKVAAMAWQDFSNWNLKSIDGRINAKIKQRLERLGVQELLPIKFDIDDFYKKRGIVEKADNHY